MKFWKSLFYGFSTLTLWPAPIKRKYFKTDSEAMASDWKAVGLDLEIAMAKLEDEIRTKNASADK